MSEQRYGPVPSILTLSGCQPQIQPRQALLEHHSLPKWAFDGHIMGTDWGMMRVPGTARTARIILLALSESDFVFNNAHLTTSQRGCLVPSEFSSVVLRLRS